MTDHLPMAYTFAEMTEDQKRGAAHFYDALGAKFDTEEAFQTAMLALHQLVVTTQENTCEIFEAELARAALSQGA